MLYKGAVILNLRNWKKYTTYSILISAYLIERMMYCCEEIGNFLLHRFVLHIGPRKETIHLIDFIVETSNDEEEKWDKEIYNTKEIKYENLKKNIFII